MHLQDYINVNCHFAGHENAQLSSLFLYKKVPKAFLNKVIQVQIIEASR